MALKRHVVRVSSLDALAACPSWAGMDHGSDASARGSAVHEVMEHVLEGREPDVHAIARRWNVPVEELATYLSHAPELEGEWRTEVPLHAERTFEDEGVEIVLSGTADALTVQDDGTVAIVDWKTSRNHRALEEGSIQLRTYCAIAASQLGADSVFGMLVYLLDNEQVVTRVFGREEIEEILDEAFAIALESYRSEKRRVGAGCSFCEKKGECDAFLADLKPVLALEETALTPDNAVKLYHLRQVIRNAESRISDLLKDWTLRAGGSLVSPDGELRLVTQMRKKPVSERLIREALIESGADEKFMEQFIETLNSMRAQYEMQMLRFYKSKGGKS